MTGAKRGSQTFVLLVLVLAFLTTNIGLAEARQTARIGVDGCTEPAGLVRPGSPVRIVACFEEDEFAEVGSLVVFVEHGPSPSDAVTAETDANGEAAFDLSSPSLGISLVMACTAAVCSPPLRLVWSDDGSEPAQVTEPHPPLDPPAGAATKLAPQIDGFTTSESGEGTVCATRAAAPVPSFAALTSVETSTLPHPKTTRSVSARAVTTGSPLVPGSVIFQTPVVVALLARQGDGPAGPADGGVPAGANRVFAFYSQGDARIGKFELAYDGERWVEVPPSFTVTAQESQITFFPDAEPFPDETMVSSRAAGLCDTSGRLASDQSADDTRRGPAVAVGIAILLLMGGLTLAILRSSEPPSKGIVVDLPAGPMVSFERSDVTYDALGRPLSFVDILETPGGGTHTIRGSIAQESLVVEAPDILDPSDWEDEMLFVERTEVSTDARGRPISFWETISTPDGTSQRTHIRSVLYDDGGRVVRFERAIEVAGGMGAGASFRTEIIDLVHESHGQPPGSGSPLASVERVSRTDLRYDAEGHVAGAMCTTVTDGSGELIQTPASARLDAPVPQPMWWAGLSFPDVSVAASVANRGMSRLRYVLTRWFRAHGCRVTVVVTDAIGNALPDLPIRFGGQLTHLDRRGHQTFWVLRKGNYAISTVEGFLPFGSQTDGDRAEQRYIARDLIGWVSVSDIPGIVEARFAVSLPAAHSRVGDQP